MRLQAILIILLIVIINSVIIPETVFGAERTDPKHLEQLIDRTKVELTRQKRKEKSVLGSLAKQQRELATLVDREERIQNQLSLVRKKYNSNRAELRKLQRSLNSLQRELEEKQGICNQRVVALYKYGPQSFLEILLSAENFGDLISKYTTLSYVIQNDLQLIEELSSVKQEIESKREAVVVKVEQVESDFQKTLDLKKRVSKEQEKISSKVDLAKQELIKIQSDRIKLEKALEELEETSKEIENAIKKDQQLSVSGGALGTGKMLWPVKGRITSNFGWRYHPVVKKKKYHSGLDIAVRSGTPIAAADSGVVLVSGWRGGYGNFLAIDHGNGISTCYGHNSRLLVKVGEKVIKGQTIAFSGNTGLSTGPHLHFEVRINGAPANPIPHLP
ncbi:MAG: murein hydrolase activator EnvC family protein [Bacteroidota bacterium]